MGGGSPVYRRPDSQFLVRTPGVRICRSWPVLADLPRYRSFPLGRFAAAGAVAGACPERKQVNPRPCRCVGSGDRSVIRRRPDVGAEHAYLDNGVLALVGGPSLG